MLRARPHAIHFKPILDFETYCRLSKVLAARAIDGVMDSSREMFFGEPDSMPSRKPVASVGVGNIHMGRSKHGAGVMPLLGSANLQHLPPTDRPPRVPSFPAGIHREYTYRPGLRLLLQIRNYQEALGSSSVRRSIEPQRKHLKLAIRKQLSPASTFSKLICHESRLMKAARLRH